jgi:hypothetical protein
MHTDAADVGFGGTLDVKGNPGDPGQWQDEVIWVEQSAFRSGNSRQFVWCSWELGRTREEGGNTFIEAMRRQPECRSRDKRIRGVQQAHDEGTPSLEEGARRSWAPDFVRVDTISGEQIR